MAAYSKQLLEEKAEWVEHIWPQYIEALWSSCRWDILDSEVEVSQGRSFESDLGLILSAARHQDKKLVARRISAAREQLFLPLAAAFSESYQRAYALMLQLHMLHDIELRLCPLPDISGDDSPMHMPDRDALRKMSWDARLQIVTPSFKVKEPILRLHRALDNLLW
jgi:hypothetical protein